MSEFYLSGFMTIGIHACALLKEQKTGIEKYLFELIKSLAAFSESRKHKFILYTRKTPNKKQTEYLNLPDNFKIKVLRFPFFWTQIRLSLEMLFNAPDVLFSPTQVLPFFSPKNSVLTVHGLEYEMFPETYSFFRRVYLRYFTVRSAKKCARVITPSESTKNDLIRIYKISEKKIFVVPHGFESDFLKERNRMSLSDELAKKISGLPYILYVGRVETKKNLIRAIRAFNLAKSKFHLTHKFVLAGGKGFGFDKIKKAADKFFFGKDVIFAGFVSENEKAALYQNADIFIFVSLYEGFGIPILEAQSFGVPTITSKSSSMSEVAGNGAVFVNSHNVDEIATALFRCSQNQSLRKTVVLNGRKNLTRFSWQKCAKETLAVLVKIYGHNIMKSR